MSPQILADDVGISQQVAINRFEMDIDRQLNGRVRDFRLLFHLDGLILQGSAATFYAKQLAQHAVMAATRLPILTNDIEVLSVNLESLQPDLSLA